MKRIGKVFSAGLLAFALLFAFSAMAQADEFIVIEYTFADAIHFEDDKVIKAFSDSGDVQRHYTFDFDRTQFALSEIYAYEDAAVSNWGHPSVFVSFTETFPGHSPLPNGVHITQVRAGRVYDGWVPAVSAVRSGTSWVVSFVGYITWTGIGPFSVVEDAYDK